MSTKLNIKFEEWRLFIALADSGSISSASRILEIDASSLKRRLDAFEAKLSMQLFIRSRNGLTLTVSGRSLYSKVKPLVEATLRAMKSASASITTRSRIFVAMPKFVYESIGFSALKRFELENPNASVDLAIYESDVPEWAKKADIFISSSLFGMANMIKIGSQKRIICASAEYCMREGAPIIPDDLVHHKVFGVGIRARKRGFLVSEDIHYPISLSNIIECSGYSELEARIAASEGIAIAMPQKLFDRLSKTVELTRIMPNFHARDETLWASIAPKQSSNSAVNRLLELIHIQASRQSE